MGTALFALERANDAAQCAGHQVVGRLYSLGQPVIVLCLKGNTVSNPLSVYRRTQRELRRHFDTFTRENCAGCPTPCCRQPARILPTDILLAEATGWKNRIVTDDTSGDRIAEIAGRVASALHNPPETAEADPESPVCEYLGESGCTFPADLRPFGCTAYICRYMREKLDRPSLARIKRLVRELDDNHRILLRTLHSPASLDRRLR